MKKLKNYILITLSLLVSAIIGAVLVWYFLILVPIRDVQNQADSIYQEAEEAGSEFLDSVEEKSFENEEPTNATDVSLDTNNSSQNTAPIIIKKSSLPEAQQSILTTFGFKEEIVITPKMKVCAESKLGAERLAEIVSGATPSFGEATSLVSCLKN